MAMKKISTIEQSLLCASIYINNFKRVIEELVYNSLDASASSIAIRICIQENFIQVLDNGNGISKHNFALLGQKYATSKYIDINTLKSAPDKYGYRGLCLASIIDIAQNVQISSRFEKSNETWMKIFLNGKEKKNCKTVARPSKGTTVEIRGFLYNLNIQRKSIDPHNELVKIKTALQQLSLVHCNVSISLRDDSKNNIIFQIHKNRTIHDTLRSVFLITEKDCQELQVEKNEYKVKAFIGKNSVESNYYYQYIYLNGKFIHKSILHKKLNDSLSNSLSKNKRINEVENMYLNRNVPFYFVLITCPNYDYDVTYNSEKSIVEFKNWKEVDRLIEKLSQFYSGDLVLKKKEILKIGSSENKSHIKTEIKEIMEKILNNKNKHTKISLQNGVKGKILKRNRKKKKNYSVQKLLDKKAKIFQNSIDELNQQSFRLKRSNELKLKNEIKGKVPNVNGMKALSVQKVLNNKTESNDPWQSKDFHEPPNINKLTDQLNQQTSALKRLRDSQTIPNNLTKELFQNKRKYRNHDTELNKTEKFRKKPKTNLICKDSLIARFEKPTESLKRRCKYLDQLALKLLENNIFKQQSCVNNSVYSFLNNETRYQSVTKNNENLTLWKKTKKVLKEENKIKLNLSNDRIVLNSYDLINTVMDRQYKILEEKSIIMTPQCRKLYEIKGNCTYKESFIPVKTYNSHKYNLEDAGKIMGGFICETSRNNFFLREQESLPISDSNHLKFPVDKSRKSKILNKFNIEVQDLSYYTIEMTENHEIINNCKRNTLHSLDCNFRQSDNHTKSIQFGNTYTFKDFVRSSYKNNIYTLNKTFSLQTINGSNSGNYFEDPTIKWAVINNNEMKSNKNESKKDNLIIPESESDNEEMIVNNIDPINFCEALLYSHNDLKGFENEFESSFVYIKDTITLSNYNVVRKENSNTEGSFNRNNNLRQSINKMFIDESYRQLNISKSVNKINNSYKKIEDKEGTSVQNIEAPKGLCKEIVPLTIVNKNGSDLIYDFQLKSRHRFMPKGMSPISTNQYELQYMDSFVVDEVYYKDMIYENFANDVLLNTKIFEPGVQNGENLFSKHKEKVNSEIQMLNGDLIFDSLSLAQAKVLGQVDRKFIASILCGMSAETGKSSEFLVLFDQHAVDERIRLESNLSDYKQGSNWRSIEIDPVSIVLSKDDIVYFVNHREKLSSFGLQWTFRSEYEILLNAIPKAILGKTPRQVEIVMKTVKKLILEQIKAIKSLRGFSLYPKTIMELVFNEACRYAIKFGDKLTKSECTNMIKSLVNCKTPFQCAHGRPVIAVLMELQSINRIYEVNLTQIKKFKNML